MSKESQGGKIEDSKRRHWTYIERQRRKIDRGKEEDRKRRKQKRIGYKKTKIKKIYVSIRKQITTKEGRKKTTKLRFAQNIYPGEISSTDPSEGSSLQPKIHNH